MRAFVAAFVILAVLIGIGIGSDIFLGMVEKNMDIYHQRIEEAAENEDFNNMREAYEGWSQYWNSRKGFLAALVDHAHTIEIEKALSELEASIRERDVTEVRLAGARIKISMQAISDNERFHLGNIL